MDTKSEAAAGRDPGLLSYPYTANTESEAKSDMQSLQRSRAGSFTATGVTQDLADSASRTHRAGMTGTAAVAVPATSGITFKTAANTDREFCASDEKSDGADVKSSVATGNRGRTSRRSSLDFSQIDDKENHSGTAAVAAESSTSQPFIPKGKGTHRVEIEPLNAKVATVKDDLVKWKAQSKEVNEHTVREMKISEDRREKSQKTLLTTVLVVAVVAAAIALVILFPPLAAILGGLAWAISGLSASAVVGLYVRNSYNDQDFVRDVIYEFLHGDDERKKRLEGAMALISVDPADKDLPPKQQKQKWEKMYEDVEFQQEVQRVNAKYEGVEKDTTFASDIKNIAPIKYILNKLGQKVEVEKQQPKRDLRGLGFNFRFYEEFKKINDRNLDLIAKEADYNKIKDSGNPVAALKALKEVATHKEKLLRMRDQLSAFLLKEFDMKPNEEHRKNDASDSYAILNFCNQVKSLSDTSPPPRNQWPSLDFIREEHLASLRKIRSNYTFNNQNQNAPLLSSDPAENQKAYTEQWNSAMLTDRNIYDMQVERRQLTERITKLSDEYAKLTAAAAPLDDNVIAQASSNLINALNEDTQKIQEEQEYMQRTYSYSRDQKLLSEELAARAKEIQSFIDNINSASPNRRALDPNARYPSVPSIFLNGYVRPTEVRNMKFLDAKINEINDDIAKVEAEAKAKDSVLNGPPLPQPLTLTERQRKEEEIARLRDRINQLKVNQDPLIREKAQLQSKLDAETAAKAKVEAAAAAAAKAKVDADAAAAAKIKSDADATVKAKSDADAAKQTAEAAAKADADARAKASTDAAAAAAAKDKVDADAAVAAAASDVKIAVAVADTAPVVTETSIAPPPVSIQPIAVPPPPVGSSPAPQTPELLSGTMSSIPVSQGSTVLPSIPMTAADIKRFDEQETIRVNEKAEDEFVTVMNELGLQNSLLEADEKILKRTDLPDTERKGVQTRILQQIESINKRITELRSKDPSALTRREGALRKMADALYSKVTADFKDYHDSLKLPTTSRQDVLHFETITQLQVKLLPKIFDNTLNTQDKSGGQGSVANSVTKQLRVILSDKQDRLAKIERERKDVLLFSQSQSKELKASAKIENLPQLEDEITILKAEIATIKERQKENLSNMD